MNTLLQPSTLRRSVLALALAAIFAPVQADDDVAQLIRPDSVISIGAGALSGDAGDRAIYGQYSGKRKHDMYAIVDIDYNTRDDASGTWMHVNALNLALDNREFGFSREKQGDWKYGAQYSELSRDYLRTINTGMSGVGSSTPTVQPLATPGSGRNYTLGTTRKAVAMNYEKWVNRQLQFEVNFKNEEKTGSRLWGRGYDCNAAVCGSSTSAAMNQSSYAKSAILLLAEPIDSVTRQIDARMNYHDDKLLIGLGYYGSFYNNQLGSLNASVPNSFNSGLGVPLPGYPAVSNGIIPGGGTSLQNVMQSALALPPDNQAHQMYLDGSYAFTRKAKANFKIAYTHASQNDSFLGNGLGGAPGGANSLDARVDTLLTQLGFTMRPTSELSLLANVRYENRDDKTPLLRYNVVSAAATPATVPASYTNSGAYWNNNRTSNTRTAAKLEASYRLAQGWRATLGGDYTSIEREVPTSLLEDNLGGLGALRGKNHENGYRAELRRSMSETLNGAISYSSSKRSGSDWTSLSTLNPNAGGVSAANLALIKAYCGGSACYGQRLSYASILALSGTTPFPASQTDLKREKWKLSLDWTPVESLNLQLVVEDGKDTNTAPTAPLNGGKGWRDSGISLYSLDAAYMLSEKLVVNAYASHSDQTQHINHSTGYMADLNNLNDAAGIGLKYKHSSKLQFDAKLEYLNDKNKYGLAANTGVSGTSVTAPSAANLAQAAIGLPDATFRQLGLRLAASYRLQNNADLRIDYGYSHNRFYEWHWNSNGIPFTYADNTSVAMQNRQSVSDIAVRYSYRF